MKKNSFAGAFLMFAGFAAISNQLMRDKWNTPGYIKVVCGVVLISIGTFVLFRARSATKDAE